MANAPVQPDQLKLFARARLAILSDLLAAPAEPRLLGLRDEACHRAPQQIGRVGCSEQLRAGGVRVFDSFVAVHDDRFRRQIDELAVSFLTLSQLDDGALTLDDLLVELLDDLLQVSRPLGHACFELVTSALQRFFTTLPRSGIARPDDHADATFDLHSRSRDLHVQLLSGPGKASGVSTPAARLTGLGGQLPEPRQQLRKGDGGGL